MDNKQRLEALRVKGYDFNISRVLQKGWGLFLAQPILSVAFTMLIFSISFLFFLYLKDFSLLSSIFLMPPLYTGFYLIAYQIRQNEPVVYPDFFKGFGYYIPVVSIYLIGQILTAIGFVLLVIPGIYLAVAYSFSVLMAIFGGFDFWTAMEESRKLITIKWWKFFLFTLVLIAINIGGAIFLGLGLLISIPVTFYATYVLFEELTADVLVEEEVVEEN